MFESLDDKNALVQKVQNFFIRQQNAVQQLGIAGGTFADKIQAQQQVKAVAGKAPQVSFIDTRDRGNGGEITTQKGSAVPSVDLHKLLEASSSLELSKRVTLNHEIDRIVYSNTIIYQSEKDCIDLAFSKKGYTTGVEPSKAVKKLAKKNPELLKRAEQMAANIDPLWQNIESKQKLKKKKARGRCYLRYGNVPINLISTESSGIINYRGLPPHAMKINLDEQLRFKPNQSNAYQQFDAWNLAKLIDEFYESEIVWCGNFELEWLIYGVPPILSGLGECRSLIRSKGYVNDARGWAQPKKYVAYGDAANNPIDPQNLAEAQWNTREEKARRGESIHGYEEEIINGFLKNVTMVAPSTDYFSKLEDLIFDASSICALYGMNMARKLNPETITRSTMEKIDQFVLENADSFLLDLVSETDEPIFERVVSEVNRCTLKEREATGIYDPTLLIDPTLVELVVHSNAPKVAERLNEDAKTVIEAYKVKLMPRDFAIQVICRAVGLDHEQAIILLDKAEKTPNEDPNDLLDDQLDPQNQNDLEGFLQ